MPCPTVTPVRSCNPRRKKAWTYEQAASRKEKAENFTRDVLEDDERADEIADMSVEAYAAERGVDLQQGDNMKRKNGARPSQASTGESRENPAVAALQTATRALDQQNKLQARLREVEDEVAERDKLLDKIDEIRQDADLKDSEKMAEIDELFDSLDEEEEGED